ncbi:hypothetical protein [Marinoscillum sp.]|uniref:hypothetical protein n=1 Tax=Marinoscillum sp. TaxID=2024838 RepID=UPI003BA9068C
MKSISPKEIDLLKDHLIKKPFKYQEVFLEVLDHYATAYEQSDETLDQTVTRLDQIFTPGKIEMINERYLKDLTRKMRKAHFTFFTNYFRWPQLITTFVVIAVFITAAPLLHAYKPLKVSLFILLAILPLCFAIYAWIKAFQKRKALPGKLKNGHFAAMGTFIVLTMNYAQVNTFYRFFSGNEQANIFEISAYWTAGFLLLGLMLCSTSLQVFWTKVKPNLI